MKTLLSRIFGLLLWVCLAISGAAPQPASAEFTLLDVAGSWYFYSQRGVGQRNAACQVVSCAGGDCVADARSRVQFSLYDARNGRGVWPEFISPRRVAPGTAAKLEINGHTYTLRNPYKVRDYYQLVTSAQDAQDVLSDLKELERQDRNGKFFVQAADGRRYSFTVRGVSTVLGRMARRCTPS